jgi:hypothetical protein
LDDSSCILTYPKFRLTKVRKGVQSKPQSYYKNRVSGQIGRLTLKNQDKLTTDNFKVILVGDYSLNAVEWYGKMIRTGSSQVWKVLGSTSYGSVQQTITTRFFMQFHYQNSSSTCKTLHIQTPKHVFKPYNHKQSHSLHQFHKKIQILQVTCNLSNFDSNDSKRFLKGKVYS